MKKVKFYPKGLFCWKPKLFQQQQHEIQFPWFSTFERKIKFFWLVGENQGSKILVGFGGLLRKLKIDQGR